MPLAFELAIAKGAKVITKKLKKGKYIRLALMNGKWFKGEVHKKKGEK